ncbi:MAG: hypothetical protein BWK80_59585 [Desulfobacteraceae bacterium IS3]|nr:MAG: hypothetical protein BWK80_59585 [Desulfobacteraceae bacterium IS3]
MDKIASNIDRILELIEESPEEINFNEFNETMTFYMEIMSSVLYLLRVGVSLVPQTDKKFSGYTKSKAIIVGHMIRISKLYDGFYIHVAKRQLELCSIFVRLIFETEIRLRYLLNKPQKSFDSFVLSTFRAEKEMLKVFDDFSKERELLPIEVRMQTSILKEIEDNNLTKDDVLQNKTWDIDGKNIRAMLRDLGREEEYPFTFGLSSRWVHGSWSELMRYHLIRDNDTYNPSLDYADPDLRTTGPISYRCLNLLKEYLIWNNSDPNQIIIGVVEKLGELILSIDRKHENWLNR